ncbi:MAG: molybdopterin-dependent oxidoreductase [Coriobacteriales bacterium]|jgi:anaerobic selenocysteine-containing dehydrogenase|nr:molybdopterin-dependent oxidoreductase [Coriobacteriales bacterium]
MTDYQEFLDGINREAYHEGEWRWEEDGYTVTRTYHYSPPGCHDSCGILLYTKDGKVERVEGDPLAPYNDGRLCMRCLNLTESINSEHRVRYPMKRVGEKGGNEWERISWDEAYDIIEARVREIWAKDGGNSIFVFHGTGRNINWQVPWAAKTIFHTPNIGTFGFTGFSCYLPRVCGSMAPLGDFPIADAAVCHDDRYNNPEWKVPECIIVWGNEPLKSNGDGYLGHWLVPCVQNGAKIISIDPRLTWWGARAEYFLQLRPGTDAALGMAMLQVIISEGLYDQEFVDYWCAGLDELWAAIEDKTPEWAAEVCWLNAEDIRGAARLFATSKPACIQWGLAFDQQMSAMALNLCACDLMAITGNVDNPGGNILTRNAFDINAGYSSGEDQLPPEWGAKKLTSSYTFGRKGAEYIALADSDCMLYALETEDPFPCNMIWCESSNTIACPTQDSTRVHKALQRCPFVVNVDPYMTPFSIAYADILLPVAMSAERNSARTWWTPARTMKKVSEYYEAKSDEQIIVELGRRLNPEYFIDELQLETDVDLVDWYLNLRSGSFIQSNESATGMGGLTEEGGTDAFADEFNKDFDGLTEACGYQYDSFNATYYKYQKGLLRGNGELGFATPSGRIELAPTTFTAWGLSPTPFHVEPLESPYSTPELMQEYPLLLTCGGRSYEFFHSEHRQLPTMREFHPLPLVTINPATAASYGIKDGAWVWVENDKGRFKQIAKLSCEVNEKTVHAEHGWWFPETEPAEPNLYGVFDSNVNNCTRVMQTGEGDIGSSIKSMICKIYPYVAGDELPQEVVSTRGSWTETIPGQA